MNLMRRAITILTVLVVWFPIFAQLEIGKQNEQPVVPTWESYEFMKYGTIGASPYTGTVNYSIPLYTYKDKDFEFPISLEYATNGYRVNHSSGLLGNDWSLSCLGRITRKIRGIPDEDTKRLMEYDQTGVDYHGYSFISGSDQLFPILLYQSNGQVYTSKYNGQGQARYETEPDEYTFNFCGYSGSFQRTSNNNTINGQKFFIYDASGDSRGLKISIPLGSNPAEFEIIDLKGYKYEFKRDEYYKIRDFMSSNEKEITISWALSKIIAPSGRMITFNYSPHTDNYSEILGDDTSYNPTQNYYFMFCGAGSIGINSNVNEIHENKYYKSKLQSIDFCGIEQIFINTVIGEDEWRYLDANFTTKSKAHVLKSRIDNIRIVVNGDVIKTCKFDYVTNISSHEAQNGGGNCVTFLKKINISGEGQYTFDYINEHGYFPYLGTCEYDHWGYYNGRNTGFRVRNCSDFHNYLSYDSCYNETIHGISKNPSYNHAVSGSIWRITYPTGGYSLIDYEPHDYSMEVVRRSHSSYANAGPPFFQPELDILSYNKQAGGIRIKQIITHLNDEEPNDTTRFIYSLEANPELSSGIMIASPRYGIEYNTLNNLKNVKYYQLSNSIYDYHQTHIEYSSIKEIKSDRGCKIYNYSSSIDEIDRLYDEDKEDRIGVGTCGIGFNDDIHLVNYNPCSKHAEMALTPMASYQTMRGKLLCASYYNANGELLRKVINNYSFPLVNIDTTLIITGEVAKNIYSPRFNVELTKITTTDYSGNISLSKFERYVYNDLGLPTSIMTNTSNGSSIRTNLYYVCDSMTNSGVIADMAESHNLAQLLKKEQYKISNGIEKLISAEKLEYYHPDLNNLALACPIAKYSWLNGQQWKLAESYQYDDKGNLVERTDVRGVSDSYLWGYHGRYLVGQVKNLPLSGLNNSLTTSPSQIREMATIPDNTFNELKNMGSQQSSLVSLYRYRPGVGLTEAVAPNLSTTTYDYNGYGKLTEIRDNDGHTIEEYDYNSVTVEPLSVSLECDTTCYKNGELVASIECNGGSGLYSYHWAIIKANGDTSVVDSVTSIVFSPLDLLIPSGQYCTIECSVHDIVSEESSTLSQSVYIKPSILRFENIVESVNPSNSSAIITASIYCDNNVSAQFCFERICTGQCSVSVGNSSYSNFVNKRTYFYMALHPGWNNVTLTVSDAEIADVELSIVSAEGHDIGVPSSISAQI